MKHIYFFLLFLFSLNISFAQDEALLGQWTLDSIFDYDILLENPINQIILNFSSETNSVTIDGFCENTYETFYTPSTSENLIGLSQTTWSPEECDESLDFEIAIYNLLSNYDGSQKNIAYTITDDGTTISLELSYTYIYEGIVEGVYGFFTKQLPPPAQLLNNWYLDQMVVDNVVHNNYYNENMDIIFTSSSGSSQDNLMYEGASSCNFYSGDYTADSNTITLNSMAISLTDCSGTPRGIYEHMYIINVLGGNTSLPNILNYAITSTGDEEVLTITNPNTSDYAVYGKTPGTSTLVDTWYLSRIEIPGAADIIVPVTDFPSLTFTNSLDPIFFYTTTEGFADCNGFTSGYEISLNTNGDNIQIRDFVPTLAACSSDYEDAYFSILESASSNYFEFEIINDGSTLIMTDLLGATLVFGDAPLSVDDYELNSIVKLMANPVATMIELDLSDELLDASYSIATVRGQYVEKGKLTSNSIVVDRLQSGIYFLVITAENNVSKTLKFIKK